MVAHNEAPVDARGDFRAPSEPVMQRVRGAESRFGDSSLSAMRKTNIQDHGHGRRGW